jgi:hypothetical protein
MRSKSAGRIFSVFTHAAALIPGGRSIITEKMRRDTPKRTRTMKRRRRIM